MKQYELSEDRIVIVKKAHGQHTVIVKEKDSDVKRVEFTPSRWALFRISIEEIERSMKSLIDGNPVNYKSSIGGGYYISVTSGFYCVDIRKFWLPFGQAEEKPTRRGLALRLREWSTWKKIMSSIDDTYPTLAAARACYLGDDHNNQQGALQCSECNPFSQNFF